MAYRKKQTNEDQAKIKRLNDRLTVIEKDQDYKNYVHFLRLSASEKSRLTQDWDKYFKDVLETRSAKRWAEMGKAVRSEMTFDVNMLGEESRLQIASREYELETPRLADPRYLMQLPIVAEREAILKKREEILGNVEEDMESSIKESLF